VSADGPHAGRRRPTLAVQVTALCVVVAVVAVGVAAVLVARLVGSTAQDVLQQNLSNQADVIAGQLADAGVGARLGARRLATVLEGEGVTLVLVGPAGRLAAAPGSSCVGCGAVEAATDAGAGATAHGVPVSASVDQGGRTWLVEGRPATTGGFALVQPVSTNATVGRYLVGRLLLALAVGLAVAVVAGLLLARVLARPLRRTAAAAHTMAAGDREVRVPVEGAAEVADVATALNGLAGALQHSEARQREFLMSVSHELRTPLTAVAGFAESLADGVVTGAEVPAVGRTIGREAQRLDRLVGDLLDLARLGADDFRLDVGAVDLGALVEETGRVWLLRSEAKGVPLHVAVGGTVPVAADARRLRQVLDGLLENALRVTPPGRPVVLEAAGTTVQVRDGGPGLAPDDYAVAFDRGALRERYGDSRPGGVGIGLSLVDGLVRRMGGAVVAGPAPEGGAAFTVTLAAHRGATSAR
jgi:signal transduction histidine kinase